MTDAERALLILLARIVGDSLDTPASKRIEIRDLLRTVLGQEPGMDAAG